MRWLLGWAWLAMLLGGAAVGTARAQELVVPLYAGAAPGSEGKTAAEHVRITEQGEHVYTSIHHPTITVYQPAAGTATGVGVLLLPGGGHKELWADHEGFFVAAWLRAHGIAAFVLKYRLAREAGSTYTVDGTELGDVAQAMRLIRSRGKAWDVDPARLGVMGFSAGGELAAMVSTRDVASAPGDTAGVARQSSRPEFEALLYPAIPQVMPLSRATPMTFLACGADDEPRIAEGVPELYLRMRRAGVPVEMHVLAGVGHGFGLRAHEPANVRDWPDLFLRWLESAGMLPKNAAL